MSLPGVIYACHSPDEPVLVQDHGCRVSQVHAPVHQHWVSVQGPMYQGEAGGGGGQT
jgi:hypothetical protein